MSSSFFVFEIKVNRENFITILCSQSADIFFLWLSSFSLHLTRFTVNGCSLKKHFLCTRRKRIFKMSTFRLATVNAHSFRNPSTGKNTCEELASILKPFKLDLIAVQEIIENNSWKRFCELVDLPYYQVGLPAGSYLGNGFACRYPIREYSNQRTTDKCKNETRGFLQCVFDATEDSFLHNRTFAVTHLDHLDEKNRLRQIKEFDPLEKKIDVLLGDMNSLSENDYSDEYFEENIRQLRQKSNWEPPFFDLTNFITKQLNYRDAFRLKNPDLKDEKVVTCRFHTRIDYIYLKPNENDSWSLEDCFIINTSNVTDHNAVFASFQKKD